MKKQYPDDPVLIVDDEESILRSTEVTLVRGGIPNVKTCSDPREAVKMITSMPLSMVMLDLSMPFISGDEILAVIMEKAPETMTIVLTANNTVDSAVSCMRKGAFDYLVKPVARDRLLTTVKHALSIRGLKQENELLMKGLLSCDVKNREPFASIVTSGGPMHAIFTYVEAVAGSSTPILITGETGVGKELLARAVHSVSGRKGRFVAVNVAGLDDNMFSDTLFGHKKGAFTGADSNRAGVIEEASGGSLFLDEIGDLSMASQVKLLRLLQDNEYMPLGSDRAVKSDARIIVATNADLSSAKTAGRFRADLYFRLSAHHIRVPPLRERRKDIPVLVEYFVRKASEGRKNGRVEIPPDLLPMLETYSFPGNVRELDSMVRDAVSRSAGGCVSVDVFAQHIAANSGMGTHLPVSSSGNGLMLNNQDNIGAVFGNTLPSIKEVKKLLIEEAMKRSAGNITKAADMLGTSRQALSWHLKSE